MSIIVYSKPACVQCHATTRALDRKGLDYQVIGPHRIPVLAAIPCGWRNLEHYI